LINFVEKEVCFLKKINGLLIFHAQSLVGNLLSSQLILLKSIYIYEKECDY